MKNENKKLYLSPTSVMIQIMSEQVFLAASNVIQKNFGFIDNEEFGEGGTFSDWV